MCRAEIPAETVLKACERYHEARLARVRKQRQELVDSLVGTRKWIWSKPITPEEAESMCADEFDWIEFTGGFWHNKVTKLQSLAKIAVKSNSLIELDSEMANILNEHFE